MANIRLDGAGTAKMKTLDDAMLLVQRIHNLAEQYALAVKRRVPSQPFIINVRRQLPTLAENLKSHFGLISEQVTSFNLAAGRGTSDGMRVRVLREGVAQIKQAIEIASAQTKDKHAIDDGAKKRDASSEST
jgi:hypothetical protein